MSCLRNNVEISETELDDFSQRWDVLVISFFGSVLTPEFGPDSEVDVFVSFKPGSRHDLMDMVRMECELKDMLGHEVDLTNIIPTNSPVLTRVKTLL